MQESIKETFEEDINMASGKGGYSAYSMTDVLIMAHAEWLQNFSDTFVREK